MIGVTSADRCDGDCPSPEHQSPAGSSKVLASGSLPSFPPGCFQWSGSRFYFTEPRCYRVLASYQPTIIPPPSTTGAAEAESGAHANNPDWFLRWHECVYTPAAKRANLSQMSQHGPQNPQSTETFSMCRAKGDNPRLPKQITDVRARLNHPDCPRKTARVTHLFDYLSRPAGRLTGNGKFEFKDAIKKKRKSGGSTYTFPWKSGPLLTGKETLF